MSETRWLELLQDDSFLLSETKDEEAKEEYQTLRKELSGNRYAKYQNDPIGFTSDILGYTLSPDIEEVLISARDNRITVIRSANSTGKTTCMSLLAIWFYFVYLDSKVHTLAAPPLSNLATKLWGEINKIKLKHPDLFKGWSSGQMWLSRQKDRRNATDFIEGIAVPQDADPFQQMASVSGSHAPHQLYLVDEGDGVGDAVYDGIDTCMTGPHERLVIAYNPRQELGRPWKLEVEQRAHVIEMSALTHPHVVDGKERWPGAVTREVTVKRIQEATRSLSAGESPDGECFELPMCLVGAAGVADNGQVYPPLQPGYRKVVETDFWHVVLGRFSPKGGGRWYFNRPWLASRLEYWMQMQDGQPLHRPYEILVAGEGTESNVTFGTWEIYEPPKSGDSYVLGSDVAKGVVDLLSGTQDNDFHEAAIYSRTTHRQVAAGWAREGCTPEQWAGDLCALGMHYNCALMIVEVNNHGRSTLNEVINHRRYPNVYYRKMLKADKYGKPVELQEWGFETTETTKPVRDGYLRGLISDAATGWGKFDIRSPRQIRQCMQYGNLPGGKAGALAGHDDGETSISLCCVVLVELPYVNQISRLKPNDPVTATGNEDVAYGYR